MDKSLKDKAIDFKGKKYVLVSDRVIYFNETYPQGSICTEIISPIDSKNIIVKATVTIPAFAQGETEKIGVSFVRTFTGHSQATIGDGYINKTSALENAETSAVGRALAFIGIGVIEAIASVDEINKAQTTGYGSKTPYKSKSNVREHSNIEYANEEEAKQGNEATKRIIASTAASLAAKEGKALKTAKDFIDWIGENCGLDLVEENYTAILNELEKLHKRK